MKLIAGLGNPGSRYRNTRHNIGFFVIEHLCRRRKLLLKEGRGDWLEARYALGGEEIVLMEPMTYMNLSGQAVADFSDRHGLAPSDILAVVDDFQLKLGMIRLRERGSDGGHNGLASIAQELGTEDYPRLRLGIGKGAPIRKDEFVEFVLGEFTEEEFEGLAKMYDIYADCAESAVVNGVHKTMNLFNKSYLEEKSNRTDGNGN